MLALGTVCGDRGECGRVAGVYFAAYSDTHLDSHTRIYSHARITSRTLGSNLHRRLRIDPLLAGHLYRRNIVLDGQCEQRRRLSHLLWKRADRHIRAGRRIFLDPTGNWNVRRGSFQFNRRVCQENCECTLLIAAIAASAMKKAKKVEHEETASRRTSPRGVLL
jgi:hypothetical protein